MPLIWAHKGDNAGSFVEVETQAEVDKAVKDGWGQDAGATSGLEFITPDPAEVESNARTLAKAAAKAAAQQAQAADPDPADPPAKRTPAADPEDDGDDGAEGDDDDGAKGGQYATRHLEAEPPRRGPGRPRKTD